MTVELIGLVTAIVGLFGLAGRVFFFFRGRDDAKAKIDEADAEILEKQRDNNVVSLDDADFVWMRLRDKDK